MWYIQLVKLLKPEGLMLQGVDKVVEHAELCTAEAAKPRSQYVLCPCQGLTSGYLSLHTAVAAGTSHVLLLRCRCALLCALCVSLLSEMPR